MRFKTKDNWEQWVEHFQPIVNYLNNLSPYNGYMYDALNEEKDAVFKSNIQHVWSVFEGGDNAEFLFPGIKESRNTIGYIICKISWKKEQKPIRVDEQMYVYDAIETAIECYEEIIGDYILLKDEEKFRINFGR